MALLLDISALEALFEVHYKSMVITAFRIVQDRDIAEDIVQNVFINAWRKRNNITIRTSLKFYLFRSAIGQSLSYIKKIKNVNALEELKESGREINNFSDDFSFALPDTRKRTEDAIALLPPACRTVFVLSRYEQLSYKEIALKLNVSEHIVETQVSKALRYLRNCFFG